MNLTPLSPSAATDVHCEFARRCAQLGIPCWKLDLSSGALIEPEEPAALAPFLHAPALRAMVQGAGSAMSQVETPTSTTPLPGWTLVPFVHSDGSRRLAISLALLMSDSACESAQFNLVCASANLNPCNVRPVLGPIVRAGGSGAEQTVAVLNWTFADLLIVHENIARFTEQRSLFLGTVQALTASIEAKDPYTCGHSERVSLLAAMMARALNLDECTIETFRLAGLVHDVGKIGVPEAVLTKKGRLSPTEITLMQQHPEIGHRILRDIPLLKDALPGVLHHHERFDGLGYPHGLAGESIPLIARVLALCDTFDAMSSTRSYRPALPREKVVEEIHACSGTQFDSSLARLFVSLDFGEVDALLLHEKQRQAA